MNKHILLVMKWLNDKGSVAQEALKDNAAATNADAYADATIAADAAADAAYYADAYYADAAYYAADAATNDTAYAATIAADAAADAAAYAEKWVTKYFERTCENKQDYIDALTAKPESPVFTQEMADNGVSATVGMEVKHQGVIKTVKCNSDINNCVVLLSVNGIYSISHTNKLEPLTPPITLIDGKAYQFDYDKYTALGFYKESDCCFYDTACFDEEIAFKVQCTNIQPLTVEVK